MQHKAVSRFVNSLKTKGPFMNIEQKLFIHIQSLEIMHYHTSEKNKFVCKKIFEHERFVNHKGSLINKIFWTWYLTYWRKHQGFHFVLSMYASLYNIPLFSSVFQNNLASLQNSWWSYNRFQSNSISSDLQ